MNIPARSGITPAWAGKSDAGGLLCNLGQDHPRVGGEKAAFCLRLCFVPGSPPRGRGKVGHSVISTISSGITPAWAGKSKRAANQSIRKKDHPRVGGEKLARFSQLSGKRGSPPRGRGKAHGCGLLLCGQGITPAWAGKRAVPRYAATAPGDHPRVGGEKTKKIP